MYTIALSREKNTDWKLATLVNIIAADDKVITYPDTNIINTFVSSARFAGSLTGS